MIRSIILSVAMLLPQLSWAENQCVKGFDLDKFVALRAVSEGKYDINGATSEGTRQLKALKEMFRVALNWHLNSKYIFRGPKVYDFNFVSSFSAPMVEGTQVTLPYFDGSTTYFPRTKSILGEKNLSPAEKIEQSGDPRAANLKMRRPEALFMAVLDSVGATLFSHRLALGYEQNTLGYIEYTRLKISDLAREKQQLLDTLNPLKNKKAISQKRKQAIQERLIRIEEQMDDFKATFEREVDSYVLGHSYEAFIKPYRDLFSFLTRVYLLNKLKENYTEYRDLIPKDVDLDLELRTLLGVRGGLSHEHSPLVSKVLEEIEKNGVYDSRLLSLSSSDWLTINNQVMFAVSKIAQSKLDGSAYAIEENQAFFYSILPHFIKIGLDRR